MPRVPGGSPDRVVQDQFGGGGGGGNDHVVVDNFPPLPIGDDYDFIDLGYTGDDLTSVVYKLGGSGGAIVASIAITYSGGQMDTVTIT